MTKGAPRRRRPTMAFLVLAQLLYGRHACVAWKSQTECVVSGRDFAKTLNTKVVCVHKYLEYLRRNRYIADFSSACVNRASFFTVVLKEIPCRIPTPTDTPSSEETAA